LSSLPATLLMETAFVIASTACFIAAFALSLWALRREKRVSPWVRFGVMGLGFALQCSFLYLRGQELGRCPLTNGFEILIFVSWAIVLLYFAVGHTFHLSLLGLFTVPLTALFQIIALMMPQGVNEPVKQAPDYWLEMHASLSLVAYGAFALACVAGVMFLIQDCYLRSGRLGLFFYQLPPVQYLTQAISRLLWLGFLLLTIGIVSALMMDQWPGTGKLATIALVWLAYGAVLVWKFIHGLGARKLASAAVWVFALPVLTYWFL